MRGLVHMSEGRVGFSEQSCQVGAGCQPQLTSDRNGRTRPNSLRHCAQSRGLNTRWFTAGHIFSHGIPYEEESMERNIS
jgi:hypothetical protein